MRTKRFSVAASNDTPFTIDRTEWRKKLRKRRGERTERARAVYLGLKLDRRQYCPRTNDTPALLAQPRPARAG